MWMWQETLLQKFLKIGVNQFFFHLGYHGSGRHFEFCQPPKSCHTLRWIFLQIFMKFDERNQFFLNPHFFVSMATAARFVQPIPIFVGLSLSTRCGCCSYQVSTISVWRVTCYDHFFVFQFFSILFVSMAKTAILKKSTLKSTTSHGIWYSYKVS